MIQRHTDGQIPSHSFVRDTISLKSSNTSSSTKYHFETLKADFSNTQLRRWHVGSKKNPTLLSTEYNITAITKVNFTFAALKKEQT